MINDSAGLLFKIQAESSQAISEINKTGAAVSAFSNKVESAANSSLINLGGKLDSIGSKLSGLGSKLSTVLTAPLLAIGALGVKAATDLDTIRQKFIGIEGSAEKANKKIKELQQFAANTKGVTADQAYATYEQLKPLKISDDVIKNQTKALGAIGQGADFSRNLTQIFQQSFERGDIKEAIGRMPLFENVLNEVAAKFGAKDAEGLRKMKESGKLTLEQFLSGFSDAVNNNPNFANIGESFSVKLQKSLEKASNALAPIGDVILNSIIPIIDKAAPYVENLANYFSELSPSVQSAVVGIGALVAGLAPALIVIGEVVTGVGALASGIASLGGLTAVLPVVAAIGAAVAVLGGIAASVYLAWSENFGNIKGVVSVFQSQISEAFTSLKATIQPAIDAVSKFAIESFDGIKEWWTQNGQTISQAAEKVFSNQLRGVQVALDGIRDFWKTHGEEIIAIASTAWGQIKTVISGTASFIGNAIKLVAQIINNDWSGVWETTKTIVINAFKVIGSLIAGGGSMLVAAIKLAFSVVWNLGGWLNSQFVELGKNIWQGLINGIKNGGSALYSAVTDLANNAVTAAKKKLDIQSPSKVFFAIGKDTVQGFIDGIASLRSSAQGAMASILDVSNIKTTKADKAGVELLTQLANELAGLNVETKSQAVLQELAAGKYGKLNDAIRQKILVAAQAIDSDKASKKSIEDHASAIDKLISLENNYFGSNPLVELNKTLSNPEITKAIEERAKVLGVSAEAYKAMLQIAEIGKQNDAAGSLSSIGGAAAGRGSSNTGISGTIPPPTDAGEPPVIEKQIGGIMGGIVSGLGGIKEITQPLETTVKIGQMMVDTFGQVANAVGNAVAAFIKFGSAGGSFRKFAAEIIASVAQMSAVQALFELAQGLAMSALAWFTGNPKYAASAGEHYLAAATFGVIGGVAAGIGRGVAGNSFQQQSSTENNSQTTSKYQTADVDSEKSRTVIEGRSYPNQQADQDRARITKTLENLDRTIQNGIPIKVSGSVGFRETDAQELVEAGARDSYSNCGYIYSIYKNARDGANSPWDFGG